MNALSKLIYSLDHPIVKYLIFFYFITIIVRTFIFKRQLSNNENILLICLSLVWIASFKWFALFINKAINGDEAYVYSSALTLVYQDPVPYRSVEFGTLGPLHALSFVLPQILGFKTSFIGVRVVWLIFWLITNTFTFLTIKLFFQIRNTYFYFFYPFLLCSTSLIVDFNYMYNESTSILFLSAGLYFFSLNQSKELANDRIDFLAYFILSISIYAKAHAAILAFVICGLIFYQRIMRKYDLKYIALSILSGSIVTIIYFSYLSYFDLVDDFIFFYLKTNSNYGNRISIFERFFNAFIVRSTSETYINYFVKHAYIFLIIANSIVFLLFKRYTFKLFTFLILAIATIFSISLPGTNYGHYFNYLFITFGIGIGLFFEQLRYSKKLYLSKISFLVIILSSILFVFYSIREHQFRYSMNIKHLLSPPTQNLVKSSISKYLIKLADENDQRSPKMVIFDWRNEIYIETGFLQGSHYNMPERPIGNQASNPDVVRKAQKIYLEDLQLNKPYFFLVSTTNKYSYWDMTMTALKKIPKLEDFLYSNYTFVTEIDNFQVFVRKN